jgi:hypothetical protein
MGSSNIKSSVESKGKTLTGGAVGLGDGLGMGFRGIG